MKKEIQQLEERIKRRIVERDRLLCVALSNNTGASDRDLAQCNYLAAEMHINSMAQDLNRAAPGRGIAILRYNPGVVAS